MNQHIFVLKERWVLVGESTPVDGGFDLKNAAVVRIWGTSKGVGQLALEGRQTQTVADPCGDVFVNSDAVLYSIRCHVPF